MSVKRLLGFWRENAATPAFEERDPLFDPENGQEKEREIMILPFQASLIETAGATLPRGVINDECLWLNAGNKYKHVSREKAAVWVKNFSRTSDLWSGFFTPIAMKGRKIKNKSPLFRQQRLWYM
jgi:hypothetical protein